MLRVKICGITCDEDARLCVEAGADALGFIFVESTPRYVSPAVAAGIIGGLPPFVTPVGIFWDHAPGHVKAVAEQVKLRALQLHGDEPPETLSEYRLPVIKTIKLASAADLDRIEAYQGATAFLLDSPERWSEGEARTPISWDLARQAARRVRVVLSAGLTPDNVGEAVRRTRPYGVDVNSGVEARPGKKDPDKVKRFVTAALAAAAES